MKVEKLYQNLYPDDILLSHRVNMWGYHQAKPDFECNGSYIQINSSVPRHVFLSET